MTTAASERKYTEHDRDTEQLKLRVSPDDAESIRAAAKAAGETISDYVVRLHVRRDLRIPDEWKLFDELVEVRRVLDAVPEAVRKLDADLGRTYGNLKDLFAYSPALARSHQSDINSALRAVRDLRAEIMPALLALRYAIIKPRDKTDLLLAAIGGRRRYKKRVEP
jgi:uncharacterized protein (DUF1778 family)